MYEFLISENKALREIVQKQEAIIQAVEDYIEFYEDANGRSVEED